MDDFDFDSAFAYAEDDYSRYEWEQPDELDVSSLADDEDIE